MRILPVLILLFSGIFLRAQSDYGRGFESGWKAGYCYGQGYSCVAPPAPSTPPPLANESYTNYTDGYNRGFVAGQSARANAAAAQQQANQRSREVYGASQYIPKVQFTPDYDFYLRAYERAQQQEQAQYYYQQQQQAYQAYKQQQVYQQRANYINAVMQEYQSMQTKPDSIPQGFHSVFLTVNNDYSESIKVYVKGNQITHYFYDNFYQAKVLFTQPITQGKTTVKVETMGIQTGTMEILFLDYLRNPSARATPPLKPGFVCFYGKKKKALKRDIYFDKQYLGKVKQAFGDVIPAYGTEGTISFYVKPGQHMMTITTGGKNPSSIWYRTITVPENGVFTYNVDELK